MLWIEDGQDMENLGANVKSRYGLAFKMKTRSKQTTLDQAIKCNFMSTYQVGWSVHG